MSRPPPLVPGHPARRDAHGDTGVDEAHADGEADADADADAARGSPAQRVSVTFASARGASGSWPRATVTS
ncbi:hypothetical protein C9J60_12205 [Streptomyces sp. A244]|nr:hypothetical protein C9J60_12205 [Streptomyces sp. A244]